ncbi:hypothetical protein HID58_070324, partial [Brassica napus]
SNTNNRTGGYNLEESGFIQIKWKMVYGLYKSACVFLLAYARYQRLSKYIIYHWPLELLSILVDHVIAVVWGGEIIDSHMFGRHTKNQMGSGNFPKESLRKRYF